MPSPDATHRSYDCLLLLDGRLRLPDTYGLHRPARQRKPRETPFPVRPRWRTRRPGAAARRSDPGAGRITADQSNELAS
jgi:hypothetical protein